MHPLAFLLLPGFVGTADPFGPALKEQTYTLINARPAPRARCGEDGKGYKLTLPRGWGSKIGMALKVGVLVVAAASDAGEVTGLPVPPPDSFVRGDGKDATPPSSVERQVEVVNAAYDGLAGAVNEETNELIDAAFLDIDIEVIYRLRASS